MLYFCFQSLGEFIWFIAVNCIYQRYSNSLFCYLGREKEREGEQQQQREWDREERKERQEEGKSSLSYLSYL